MKITRQVETKRVIVKCKVFRHNDQSVAARLEIETCETY